MSVSESKALQLILLYASDKFRESETLTLPRNAVSELKALHVILFHSFDKFRASEMLTLLRYAVLESNALQVILFHPFVNIFIVQVSDYQYLYHSKAPDIPSPGLWGWLGSCSLFSFLSCALCILVDWCLP